MMNDLLEDIVCCGIKRVQMLGESGKQNVIRDDKRTCLAEKTVWEYVCGRLDLELGNGKFLLSTEGFPEYGDKKSNLYLTLDPLDGTVYYARQRSLSHGAITIALAASNGKGYADITCGAIGDVRTGEVWKGEDSSANSSVFGKIRSGGNDMHDPLLLSDFYHLKNAEARIKLKNPNNPAWSNFECLNTGSVAEMLIKVACGEADAYIGISGPKGYELAAAYPICRGSRAFILDVESEKELGESGREIEPDKRVSVIAAKSEEFARKLDRDIKA